ncbi:MAG: hypothetical protein ACHQTE_02445 [Candidatus Saccharimonadales bacterium]
MPVVDTKNKNALSPKLSPVTITVKMRTDILSVRVISGIAILKIEIVTVDDVTATVFDHQMSPDKSVEVVQDLEDRRKVTLVIR